MNKKVIVSCEICGKEFATFPCRIKIGRGKYCSRTCLGKANYTRLPVNKVGENNPNWRGGISKNGFHYKQIQIDRYPDKVKARQLVSEALRSGRLKRDKCVVCGAAMANAHHEDYSKPLEITWLCDTHHREIHGGMKFNSKPIE